MLIIKGLFLPCVYHLCRLNAYIFVNIYPSLYFLSLTYKLKVLHCLKHLYIFLFTQGVKHLTFWRKVAILSYHFLNSFFINGKLVNRCFCSFPCNVKTKKIKNFVYWTSAIYSNKLCMKMFTIYHKNVYKVVILLIYPSSSCLSLWKSSQIIAQDFTVKCVSWSFSTKQKTLISPQPVF